MTELQQKQLALLEETVKFYNSKNRCTNDRGMCQYYVEGKEGCAIGRLIKDKELCKKLDEGVGETLLSGVQSWDVFNLLPENIKYYGQGFLGSLQILHDYASHWNEKGLTKKGEKEVESIKIKFNLL